jgi:ribosomal protein L7/L12
MEQATGFLTDYNELPNDIRDNLVAASMDFMRALAACASAEAAEAAWNTIADTVHPNLKHDLLMRLLAGDSGQTVTLTECGPSLINCIKTIRSYTKMGLKEAKDVCDSVRAGFPQRIRLENWRQRRDCLKEFSNNGSIAY